MTDPTPTVSGLPLAPAVPFDSIASALDAAAGGATGLNFYAGNGQLQEALPYAVLARQARLLARRFLGLGLQPGERVALIAESDGDFVRAFFACQYAGLVPAPLPLPAAFGGRAAYVQHIRRMIEGARSVAAFAPASLEAWLQEATEGLELRAVGTLQALDGVTPFEGDLPAPQPDGLCYLQFSSGSTRFPVGVAVTQQAAIANTTTIARDGLHIGQEDRCNSWLPMYHDMGLVGFLLTPVVCNRTVDYMPTREFARRPLLWLDLMTRNGATITYSPSFGFELCTRRAETADTSHIDLSRLRVAGLGGDMIRPKVLQRFAERFAQRGFRAEAYVASYGMAEATLALSFAPLNQGLRVDRIDTDRLEREQQAVPAAANAKRVREFVLCGRALDGHELQVRNDNGGVLTERAIGRIYARGPSLMRAYDGAPLETARVLSADGWLDTGDLGYLLNGEIVITGRAKDLIILNGRNIWPQDLEWTTETEVSGLRSGDVAVFSLDEEAGEQVVTLVQCRSLEEEAREALRAEVAGLLRMRHGLDVDVVLVPPRTLPQTSSGKMRRGMARQMFRQGAFEPKPELQTA